MNMDTQQRANPQWLLYLRLAMMVVPLPVYFAIRSSVGNDTKALAIAWFIPAVWALVISLWRRRIELFGLLGVAAYGIALGIAIFFNTGPLPLMLRHAVVAGIIGLVFLGSSAMGKPIILAIVRRTMNGTKYTERVKEVTADPQVIQRITTITLIVGVVLLADAVIQTVLALTLSVGAFLVATTAVHFGVIGVIILTMAIVFWIKSHR
jgi:hypothetical protein